MPDVEEAIRHTNTTKVPPRPVPPPEIPWPERQRGIRRHKRNRRTIAAATAALLLAAGTGSVLLLGDDGGNSTVRTQPAGPGTLTTDAPVVAVDVAGETETAPSVGRSTWEALAVGPVRDREGYSTTWTGRELVVWGGLTESGSSAQQPTGAAYRESIGWQAISEAPLAARADHIATWTGSELIVWGGHTGGAAGSVTHALDGGAAYDPATDTWRPIAAAPLPPDRYDGVWTGAELVVLGGGEAVVTGAAYDPTNDTWREIAAPPVAIVHPRVVWTGEDVIVVGGVRVTAGSVQQFVTWAWDPATDAWRELGGASVSSQSVEATWAGAELVVWGHAPGQEGTWVLGRSAQWSQAAGFPVECEDRIQSVAFDGRVIGSFCDTLAVFDPTTGTWSAIESPPAGAENGQLVEADGVLYVFDAGIAPGSVNFPPGVAPSFSALRPS
jgi:hypothetical protein